MGPGLIPRVCGSRAQFTLKHPVPSQEVAVTRVTNKGNQALPRDGLVAGPAPSPRCSSLPYEK